MMKMSISPIRKFTNDDQRNVNAAAERFCERHKIAFDDGEAERAIQFEIDYYFDRFGRVSRLKKLWTACYCRSLNVGIDARVCVAYGYVGRVCE